MRTSVVFMKIIAVGLLFLAQRGLAQDEDITLHSKEGITIGYKKAFVVDCKARYGAPFANKVVTRICECQVDLLERRFPIKKLRSYTRKYRDNALSKLIEEDTALKREMEECAASSKGLPISSIPEYRASFIKKCTWRLQVNNERPVNDTLAGLFCSCAADILEKRKMSLDKLEDLGDPNSFLYNEVAYTCGSPYLEPSDFARDWNPEFRNDIIGPTESDSVKMITVMGMHKVKITIGKETRIWLLDSGASDLLISDDFLTLLKKQGTIRELNFAGLGRYRLADNSVITCRRYKIDNVAIGNFRVNNVTIAASKSTKEFLVGKSLLNKFSQWMLDNQRDLLILKK